MNYWLILVPLLPAFIGWLAIRLLLFFLFRPFEPRKILGITIQGVLIKQKQQIAAKIGQVAAAEFSSAELEQKISDPRNMEKLKPLIETHVDDFLRVKLKEQMPMISMFVGDKTINTLKGVFMQEIENLFPQVMGQFAGNLKNEINIEQMVVAKINNISPATIESTLHQNLSKEFGMASLFGAIIGFLVGIVQLAIVLLTS